MHVTKLLLKWNMKRNIFLYFWVSWQNYCACALTVLTVQRWIGKRKFLQKVGKVWRGPKRSLAPFQRVSQSLAIKKPLSWASTRSLQGFYKMFCNFYRMFQKEDFGGWMERERWRGEYGGRIRVWGGPRLGGWSWEEMRMAGSVQGGVEQCCTKIWKLRQSVANVRQE